VIPAEHIEVISDIWYGNTSPNQNQPHYLDLYQVNDETLPTKRPVLVYIHGGAFRLGDKADQPAPNYCMEFAERGYIVFSINYTLDGTLSSATQDAAIAVQWVINNADKYHVDPDRIIVGGHSAGAMTSLNLGVLDDDSNGEVKFSVAGILNSAGGGAIDLSNLDVNDPPMFIINGTEDRLAPVESSRNLVKSLDRLDNELTGFKYPYSYMEVEGAGHSFIPGHGLGFAPPPIAGSPQDEDQGWSNTEVAGKNVDQHCFEFFFESLKLINLLADVRMIPENSADSSNESDIFRLSIHQDPRIKQSLSFSSDMKTWTQISESPVLQGNVLEFNFSITLPQMFFRLGTFSLYNPVTSEYYDTF
jgi:acetyl esterase/lipase